MPCPIHDSRGVQAAHEQHRRAVEEWMNHKLHEEWANTQTKSAKYDKKVRGPREGSERAAKVQRAGSKRAAREQREGSGVGLPEMPTWPGWSVGSFALFFEGFPHS